MDHIEILGYYKEIVEDDSKVKDKTLYFVAYENERNGTEEEMRTGDKVWVEGYNVIDGHFQLEDKAYLEECEQITKEEYLEGTKGFYTPEAYL